MKDPFMANCQSTLPTLVPRLKIRRGVPEDLAQVMELNRRNHGAHGGAQPADNKMLRIAYDRQALIQIARAEELVVAFDNQWLAGYYLVGRKSGLASLQYQLHWVASQPFLRTETTGYGCQVCIDTRYRGQGLYPLLLDALDNQLSGKYDHLVCSIASRNTASVQAHLREGWKLGDALKGSGFYYRKSGSPAYQHTHPF